MRCDCFSEGQGSRITVLIVLLPWLTPPPRLSPAPFLNENKGSLLLFRKVAIGGVHRVAIPPEATNEDLTIHLWLICSGVCGMDVADVRCDKKLFRGVQYRYFTLDMRRNSRQRLLFLLMCREANKDFPFVSGSKSARASPKWMLLASQARTKRNVSVECRCKWAREHSSKNLLKLK